MALCQGAGRPPAAKTTNTHSLRRWAPFLMLSVDALSWLYVSSYLMTSTEQNATPDWHCHATAFIMLTTQRDSDDDLPPIFSWTIPRIPVCWGRFRARSSADSPWRPSAPSAPTLWSALCKGRTRTHHCAAFNTENEHGKLSQLLARWSFEELTTCKRALSVCVCARALCGAIKKKISTYFAQRDKAHKVDKK